MIHRKTLFVLCLYVGILALGILGLAKTIKSYEIALKSQKQIEFPKSDLALYEKIRKPSKNGDLQRALAQVDGQVLKTSKDVLYDASLHLYSKKITLKFNDPQTVYQFIERLEQKLPGFLIISELSFQNNKDHVVCLWVRQKSS